MLTVVPDRANAGAVTLDAAASSAQWPVSSLEASSTKITVRSSTSIAPSLEADFELLDGQRGRGAAELLGHPPGGGAVHRARDNPPTRRPVGLRSRVQDRTLPGPRPAGQARPPWAADEQLERVALLGVEVLALAERGLCGPTARRRVRPAIAATSAPFPPPSRRRP